jgi:hypothetical protein
MPEQKTDAQIVVENINAAIAQALVGMDNHQDRPQLARAFAVTRTELEKVYAFVQTFLVNNGA